MRILYLTEDQYQLLVEMSEADDFEEYLKEVEEDKTGTYPESIPLLEEVKSKLKNCRKVGSNEKVVYTPNYKIEVDSANQCTSTAPAEVEDDWGDSCEGHKCLLTKGHSGNHMASDGANGYVYF